MSNIFDSDIIIKIEKWLEKYERVIVFDCCNSFGEEVLCDKTLALVKEKGMEDRILIVKISSSEELERLFDIYNMYEFSSRFMLITRKSQYPSIFNYLYQGLLMEEEFIQILLH
ncbi:MAG: hypothetical protein IJX12_07470 [Lachnospiraceae bacterium]|nr:hypothetical protein [Lachnospiraceae bacterium]